MKAYIDANYPDSNLILAGDFNDRISGIDDNDNVFIHFMNDTEDYRFVDLSIAESSLESWSYPVGPSHIDHFLVTNELFENVQSVSTLAFDQCDNRYFDFVSDHRPLLMRLILK